MSPTIVRIMHTVGLSISFMHFGNFFFCVCVRALMWIDTATHGVFALFVLLAN